MEETLVIPTNHLEAMFKQQLTLMNHYKQIGALPDFPVNLQTKAGQKSIKEQIYNCIEELGEAFESYHDARNLISTNRNEEGIKKAQDFMEELSDTTHFLLEIFLLAGEIPTEYFLHKLLDIAVEINIAEGFLVPSLHDFFVPVKIPYNKIDELSDLTIPNLSYSALRISETKVELLERLNWALTVHLTKAGNLLKNRAWKQTGVETNLALFKQQLFNVMLSMARIWDFLGLTPAIIYSFFYMTYSKNLKRLKEGY